MSLFTANPENSLAQQLKKTKQKLYEYQQQLSSKDAIYAKQIEEFNMQFKKKQAQIQKLCEQLKFLIAQHQSLKKSGKAQKAQLEAKIQAKNQQNSELQNLLDLLKEQINGSRYNTLRRIYYENQELKKKINGSTKMEVSTVVKDAEILNLKKSNKFFKDQISKLVEQFSQLNNAQDLLNSYQKEVEELRNQNSSLTLLLYTLNQNTVEKARFQKENKALKQQLNDKIEAKDKEIVKLLNFLKTQNNLKNQQSEKASVEIKSLKQKIKIQLQELSKANSEIISLNTEAKLKNAEIKNLGKRLDFMKDENSSLTILINSQISSSSNNHDKKYDNFVKNEIYLKKVLADTIEAKDKEINKLINEVKVQNNHRIQEQAQIQTYIKKLKDVKELIDQVKKEGSAVDELKRQIKNLKQQNTRLMNQYNSKITQDTKTQEKIKQSYEDQIKLLRNQNTNLRATLQTYKSKESQKYSIQRQNDSLKKQTQNKQTNIQKLQDSLKKAANSQELYKRQIQNLKQENANLKYSSHSSNSKKNDEVQRLQQENLTLRRNIAQIREQAIQKIRVQQLKNNEINQAYNQKCQQVKKLKESQESQRQSSSHQFFFNPPNSNPSPNTSREIPKNEEEYDPKKFKKNGEPRKYPHIQCTHLVNGGVCRNCINNYNKK